MEFQVNLIIRIDIISLLSCYVIRYRKSVNIDLAV